MSVADPSRAAPPTRPRGRWLLGSENGWLLLEVLAALGLLAEAVALLVFTGRLGLLLFTALCLQWLLLAVGLRFLGLLRMVGPVFFYDLVRATRRGRYFLLRGLYVLGLLFLLWCVWANFMPWGAPPPSLARLAEFGMTFFFWFISVQFAVVTLLTPAYTAGAIAEEKERRTLEFVLATDLRDREIVLGKLASRLLNLAFLVLAGVPVLALLQFVGGIDPGLLLAGFAATAITMISLASVSILFSTLVRRARDAIVLTYLTVLTYLILAGLSRLLLEPPGWADFPNNLGLHSPVTLLNVVDGFNAGSLVWGMMQVTQAMGGPTLATTLQETLAGYTLFHGLVTLACCTGAVLCVRRVALREQAVPQPRAGRRARAWKRPPVGDRPMVWKEVRAEPGPRLHWFGRVILVLLVAASFLWPVLILIYETPNYRESVNVWARVVGSGVACLMLLSVAVRAAGAVSGERDRQTLDGLLTSPLETRDILYGKWLGSVLGLRWAWVWLGSIWLLGVLAGAVHPLALPVLVGAWFVLAAFVAMLGLWFSTVSRTTLRATVWTLLTLLGVWGGHWVLWVCCFPCMMAAGSPGGPASEGLERVFSWCMEFQAFGLTPPFMLGFLAFQGDEFKEVAFFSRNLGVEFLVSSLAGLVVWGLAGLAIWGATRERFSQRYGRQLLRRPEMARPRSRAEA